MSASLAVSTPAAPFGRPRPGDTLVELPSWSIPFTRPAPFKVAYGGRASSKTWTFAHLLVGRAYSEKTKIMVARAVQTSIRTSNKPAIETAIHRMGLRDEFVIQEHRIHCPRTGSVFEFVGVENKREEIRGWEDVDIVWVDEAQRISEATAAILTPTLRKDGCELWFTFNPKHRTDWVWRRFLLNPRPKDIIRKVNFLDNKFFPARSEEERRTCLEVDPGMYRHIWLGEPDDEGADRQVLLYSTLERCIEAFEKRLWENAVLKPVDAGLDIANGGMDKNALVIRAGPVITSADRWPSATIDDLRPTALRARRQMREHEVGRIWYDANGVGAGMGGELSRLRSEHGESSLEWVYKRLLSGQQVGGPKTRFSFNMTNAEMFFNKAAQAGWSLRIRAQNTLRLLKGDKVDPKDCLFIDPDLRGSPHGLQEYLGQLSQPRWRENDRGQTQIVKLEKDELSPDMYDATWMAFGRDSLYGLTYRVRAKEGRGGGPALTSAASGATARAGGCTSGRIPATAELSSSGTRAP